MGEGLGGDGDFAVDGLTDEAVDAGGRAGGGEFLKDGGGGFDGMAAVAQGPDGRGEVEDAGEVEGVLDDDERDAMAGGEFAEVVEDIADTVGIEAGEGFIEKEDGSAGLEGAGDGDALRLAEGDAVGGGSVASGKAEGSQGFRGGLAGGGGLVAGAARAKEGHPQRDGRGGIGGGDVFRKIKRGEEADILPCAGGGEQDAPECRGWQRPATHRQGCQ